ncbi:uncharacterized protein LACBIDRAFT_332264 [Laccaria bicolor S238N-H82]|uniref:Predicted protein n=1 Tax=Laccaria bicolor (strain S238N-H82 / ATCC MYA-4686) TaxID=486041 RepID=B0DS51_LACBS|nr:uncharacterized protein LACBIDRAFT_332264 [Laccaria bicolor S238N-H82]EDR02638.1 predicted protein [Laccaria bicolor S238N-H82]|eukprot:XP_001886682.1 predicted protein [Laccaria bicolor S238N-H82]
MSSRSRWGPLPSLLVLSPVLIGPPWLAYRRHRYLPAALTGLSNPVTGLPHISEAQILGVVKHLSEGIGYRTVGTSEHALADKYMVAQAEEVKKNCRKEVRATVYFAHIGGLFFMNTFTTAKILYTFLSAASLILVRVTFVDPAPALKRVLPRTEEGDDRSRRWAATPLLLWPCTDQRLCWVYSSHNTCPRKNGVHFLTPHAIGPCGPSAASPSRLRGHWVFPLCSPAFRRILINPFFSRNTNIISLATYFLGIWPLLTGSLLTIPTIEVFVPLMGRVGAQVPTDNIASLIRAPGAVAWVLLLSMTTFALIGMIAMRTQFDEMHQKRLFVLHLENITSQEGHLHLAAADGALGFELLVQDIVNDSGATDVAPISVHREWMSRLSLLVCLNDVKDLIAMTRSLTIKVDHAVAMQVLFGQPSPLTLTFSSGVWTTVPGITSKRTSACKPDSCPRHAPRRTSPSRRQLPRQNA